MLSAPWDSHSASSVRPSARRILPLLVALAFLALHLPYLPASLEDLDSINFALGLHQFDVARHQPHPPGYPLFIAAARGVRLLASTDARALALVSVIAGALGVLAIAALFRRLRAPAIGATLAIAAPLYWLTASRPLSDMAGLAAATAVQVLALSAVTPAWLAVAAFCAGLATGLRSQVFWLTAPIVIATAVVGGRRWLAGDDSSLELSASRPAASRRSVSVAIVSFAVGGAMWAIPLVALTGGVRRYWHAVFDQGAEDLSGIRMLWTTPTIRELADALYYAFVAPWAVWWLASLVLALAAIGTAVLWRGDRRSLGTIAVLFAPYLIFDLFFQETFTSRYALPLVVPVAYLAVRGAAIVPAHGGTAAAIGVAMFGAHVGGTSLAAYAREPAPAFRLLADMGRTRTGDAPPIVAMDRREALDLRGPVKYVGGFPARVEAIAASPPQHESFALVDALNRGWRGPMWFVADPRRTDIDAVQHGEPRRYRWALPYPVLIDGVRPSDLDWYELDAPDWWVGSGWALTPELAGVGDEDRRGLEFSDLTGGLAAATRGGALILGGRNLDVHVRPRLDVLLDGEPFDTFIAEPGAFLRAKTLPSGVGRATLTIRATPRAKVAIEQFDASSTRTLVGFADGWHEQEYAPATGLRWRWLSDRGDVRIVSPTPADGLLLHIAGESPLTYFSRASTITILADGAPVFSAAVASDFALTVPIARPAAVITIETDQSYVPAERSRRTRDRRRLGLRIFSCDVRAVSARGR